MGFSIEPGGTERPPKAFRGLGMAPGVTLHEFPTQKDVTAYCNAHQAQAYDPYGHGRYTEACYDIGNRVVAIVDHSQTTKEHFAELLDHENAHSWGLVHPGNSGRGWTALPGTPAEKLMAQPTDYARVLGGMNGR